MTGTEGVTEIAVSQCSFCRILLKNISWLFWWSLHCSAQDVRDDASWFHIQGQVITKACLEMGWSIIDLRDRENNSEFLDEDSDAFVWKVPGTQQRK